MSGVPHPPTTAELQAINPANIEAMIRMHQQNLHGGQLPQSNAGRQQQPPHGMQHFVGQFPVQAESLHAR